MIFLLNYLLLLSEGGGIQPGPGGEIEWVNNSGDEIHWQNNSSEPITWTGS